MITTVIIAKIIQITLQFASAFFVRIIRHTGKS